MFSPLIQYSVDGSARDTLPIVQSVGCLEQQSAGQWWLTAVGTPVPTKTQSTSAAALRAAAATPAGSQRLELLGTEPFAPQRAGRQRVAVKGVLVQGASPHRLNVTSLQAIGGSCP
jgi:hypothetical protein